MENNANKDYALPAYDGARTWIRAKREHDVSWEDIQYACRGSLEGLLKFLADKEADEYWMIDADDWYALVDYQHRAEDQQLSITSTSGEAMSVDDGEDSNIVIPTDPASSWCLYRKKLLNQRHFKPDAVSSVESSTLKILKRLHSETIPGKAVKGLVIGNVQSGKTANMAGLMAMSADWGWNMFIVLSGTIESLRKQTQSRLYSDLNDRGNLRWMCLEYLSKKSPVGNRAQDLHFERESNERYFTVCLKNSKRLESLIKWLIDDPNKQSQMRILVIDDEADQAGITTSKIYDDEEKIERKKINKLLVNLVNGKNAAGKETDAQYRSMNYIGYTATPYANVLNEPGEASLYPRSFITTLGVSNEYFGPQQIFGVSGGIYDGLDIVRKINDNDLTIIGEIHDGDLVEIPTSLQKAICWFIDAVACRRLQDARKSVSMLVHTSQKTDHHKNIERLITRWFEKTAPTGELARMCQEVWEEETKKFTRKMFEEQYQGYGNLDQLMDYPMYCDIEPYVDQLIKANITHISMADDEEFRFNDGLHLCVDNCKNNGINEDGFFMRLTYPQRQEDLDKTPAFIVIGGQTLSRGLTLDGLVCTYFLRSVGQADTLMQMGRWFGYRRGYELLPRLWLTEITNKQFCFLSDLDQELRDEIYNMDINGIIPAYYGPRIKNTPSYQFIRITAKNRMQSAQPTDMDYSGSFNQTYLFDENTDIVRGNYAATMTLLQHLGAPAARDLENRFAKGTVVWRNIDFFVIRAYLEAYRIQPNQRIAGTMDSLIEWVDKITMDGKLTAWNVVLSNSDGKEKKVTTPAGDISLVNRSRKIKDESWQGIIDIGVLRDPRHILADVDYSKLDERLRDRLDSSTVGQYKACRNAAGLNNVPQLLLYLIDKDSKAAVGSQTRIDLNAPDHIAGYCLNIPGGKPNSTYAETVSIHINPDIFDGKPDLEDIDGN